MSDIITTKDLPQEPDLNCQQCLDYQTEANPNGCPGRFVLYPQDCPADENYVGNGRWIE